MRSTHPPRPARATNRGPSQRAGLPPSAGRSGTLSMLGMRAGQSAAVVGLRNLQAIADGGPIQRDVTVGVAAGNINAITVDRANMTSLFGGDQGDHTTAFVVFAAMFHNRLNGQTLAGARVVLHAIRGEILALPGYINIAAAPAWAQAITAAELATVNAARLVANGAGAGVTVAQINAYASALLSFRNVIPPAPSSSAAPATPRAIITRNCRRSTGSWPAARRLPPPDGRPCATTRSGWSITPRSVRSTRTRCIQMNRTHSRAFKPPAPRRSPTTKPGSPISMCSR